MDINRYFGAVYIMKKTILVALLVIISISCSKKEEVLPELSPAYIIANLVTMPYFADTLLPVKFEKHNLNLHEAVQSIRPQELLASQPNQAEHYLNHLFIGKSSGNYTFDNNKLYAEVIQFADEIRAYGYYASLRPDGVKIEKIGAESYQSGNSRYMVKSDYVVITSVENESESANIIMRDFTIELDNAILGSKSTPPFFLLFPYKNKIIPSIKYYPYQYLGIPGLNDVYTTSYLIGEDTLILFLSMDTDVNKFKYLTRYARQSGEVVESFNRFAYDSTFSIALKDDKNGVIIGGIKSQKLIGTIQYKPHKTDHTLSTWLKGL